MTTGEQSDLVKFLKGKDEAQQNVPASWSAIKQNKQAYFLKNEEKNGFLAFALNKCAQKCYKTNATSSVVNIEESECMTNCTIRAAEVSEIFRNMNLKEDGKKSILI